MPRHVLLSGGAGFIGCALAKRLLAEGAEVAVLDNLHPQVHTTSGMPPRLPREVRFFTGDVTVPGNWATVLKVFRPDEIVHLAAETGTAQSLTEAGRHTDVNVNGTAALLDALTLSKHVPAQLLVPSSRAVYGDGAWAAAGGAPFYPAGRTRQALERRQWDHLGPDGKPATPLPHRAASTHPNPISVYGATKLAQEQIMAAWCRALSCSLSVLRLQNVYGAGQAVGNPYTGVLTTFARAALAKRAIDVFEDGAIIRDFVHVDDVVRAMSAALQRRPDGVRILDVGCGTATTIHQVARTIATLAGAPEPQVSGRYRDGDVRAASAAISDTTAALGYTPQVSLDQGLTTLLDFVREQTSAPA